jgi:hypothetical protein
MERKIQTIEYFNEFGLTMRVQNGTRLVYQDIPDDSYTWISVKIDRTIALFIDLKNNQVSYNALSKLLTTQSEALVPF